MANEEHLRILKSGVEKWNAWRMRHPDVAPDLTGANLKALNLVGAQLQKVDFTSADIRGTNFAKANLEDAKLIKTRAGFRKRAVFILLMIAISCGVVSGFLSYFSGGLIYLSMENFIGFISGASLPILTAITTLMAYILPIIAIIISINRYNVNSVSVAVGISLVLAGEVAFALSIAISTATIGGLNGGFAVAVAIAVAGAIAAAGAMAVAFSGAVAVAVAGTLAVSLAVVGAIIGALSGTIAGAKTVSLVGDENIIANLTGTASATLLILVPCYFAWQVIHENEKFYAFRVVLMRLTTLLGTSFKFANLARANFTNATLQGANFHRPVSLDYICWKNASKMHLTNFYGTICENIKTRNLLKTLDRNDDKELNGLKIQNTYLARASLFNADLRNSDIDGANLSHANITGAKLFASSRENWTIEGIKCKYIYCDEAAKERTPQDGDFEPGEFEKLFKQLPTFDYFFEKGFTPIDAFVMNDIVEHIKEKHPEFELALDSFHSRGKPHAKFTVVHKEFVDQAASEIKSNFETQIKVLEGQRDQLMEVISQLTNNTHDKFLDALEIIIEKFNDRPQIQAEIIQGLNIVGEIDTLNQQGGDMGDDHINITAGGDVAFAKDQAFAQINKTISESANLPDALGAKLKDLADAVNKMTEGMPQEKAKEVTQDLQTLAEEATKDAPRKKWYQLSGQGIIDAATAVGVAGKPVIDLTREVMRLLGP